MPTRIPKEDAEQESTPVPVPENPSAGGNYIRDPVTGALTRNPDHATLEE